MLVALLCAAPVVASYALFYGWKPGATKNYGDLIPPTPVPEIVSPAAGPAANLATLKGKWVLVSVDSGQCADACRTKLWQMRQLRLAQGKDMDRVARVWLIDDARTPDAGLATEYAGTITLNARDAPGLSKLPTASSPRDHLFLVDPLGNLMMRFPKDADANRIKKDLIQLLKVSQVG
ncbi:MAG: cytochrome c oxidase subunit I [Burkholderiales bacterium]